MPVRTMDQVGALTAAFNALVERFAAAQSAYQSDLERVRAADRDRAAFLAAVSHELRSPLNAILGFADILATEVDGPLNPVAREEVEQIRSSGKHLLDLINDILELSALESGQLRLTLVGVDLGAIAWDVVREAAGIVGARPVAVRIDGEAGVYAHADPKRVRQILTNLVGNGIKFTQRGEVVVHVSREGRFARVSVRDTGPGISDKERSMIFLEYKQAQEERARRRGTGLGLAITRRLVAMHSGTIDVDTTVGQGSTFTVFLPIWAERGGPMKSPAAGLVGRLVWMQLVAWAAAGLLVAAFAPRLLLLDPTVVQGTAHIAVLGWLATMVLVVVATLVVGKGARPMLASLAVGDPSAEAADVHALYVIPSRLVAIDLTGTLAVGAATLTPRLRPWTNDLPTQAELVLLAMTMASVTALPMYIAMRAAVGRVLQLVAVSSAREAIDLLGTPERRTARVRQRLLVAVVAPVAFVAVGGSLLVHAHLRAFDASSRQNDAAELARGVLDLVEGDSQGRKAAMDAARKNGFDADVARSEALFLVARAEETTTVDRAPLADGHALVQFRTAGTSPVTNLPRADARRDRCRLGPRGSHRHGLRRGRGPRDARARGRRRGRRAAREDPRGDSALPIGGRLDGRRQRARGGVPRVRRRAEGRDRGARGHRAHAGPLSRLDEP